MEDKIPGEEIDGLIFVPMGLPYPKGTKFKELYKWKPAELNTIDFYARKEKPEKGVAIWKLYVTDKK